MTCPQCMQRLCATDMALVRAACSGAHFRTLLKLMVEVGGEAVRGAMNVPVPNGWARAAGFCMARGRGVRWRPLKCSICLVVAKTTRGTAWVSAQLCGVNNLRPLAQSLSSIAQSNRRSLQPLSEPKRGKPWVHVPLREHGALLQIRRPEHTGRSWRGS